MLVVDLFSGMEMFLASATDGHKLTKNRGPAVYLDRKEEIFDDLSNSFARLSPSTGSGKANRVARRRTKQLRHALVKKSRAKFQADLRRQDTQYVEINLRYLNMGATKDESRSLKMYEAMRHKRTLCEDDAKRLNRIYRDIRGRRSFYDNDAIMWSFRSLFKEAKVLHKPLYRATSGMASNLAARLGLPVNHSVTIPPETQDMLSRFVNSLEKGVSLIDAADIPTVTEEIRACVNSPDVEGLGARAIRAGVDGAFSHVGAQLLETCKTLAEGLTGSDAILVVLATILFTISDEHISTLGKGLILTICGYILYLLDFQDFATKIMDIMMDKFGGWFTSDKPTYNATSGMETPLTARLVHLFFLGLASPKWEDFGYAKFVKSASFFKRTSGDIADIFTTLVECAQKSMDFVCERILGVKSYRFMSSTIPQMDEWVDKVLAIQDRHRKRTLPINQSSADEVFKLYIEAIKMVGSERDRDVRLQTAAQLNYLIRYLIEIQREMSNHGLCIKGPRIEPLVIMLRGGTGVGKSFALRPIIFRLLARVLPEEELQAFKDDEESFIYARMIEQEFWDGYLMQWVVFYDEFGMTPAKMAQACSEFSEIIRVGNPFDYNLHMADVASKGSMFFRSRIVVATSNLPDIRTGAQDMVIYPDAVVRRFHFNVVVCPAKDYCTPATQGIGELYDRALDKSKLTPGVFEPRAYEFFIAHGLNETTGFKGISYEELLDLLTKKFFDLQEVASATYSSVRDQKNLGLTERDAWKQDKAAVFLEPEPTLRDKYELIKPVVTQMVKEYTPIGGDMQSFEDAVEIQLTNPYPYEGETRGVEFETRVKDFLLIYSEHTKGGAFLHSFEECVVYANNIFEFDVAGISFSLSDLDKEVFSRDSIDSKLESIKMKSESAYEYIMYRILDNPTLFGALLRAKEPLACDVLHSMELRYHLETRGVTISYLEPYTRRFQLLVSRGAKSVKEFCRFVLDKWDGELVSNFPFRALVSASIRAVAGMTIVKLIRWFFRKVFPSGAPREVWEVGTTDYFDSQGVWTYEDWQKCSRVYRPVGGDFNIKEDLVDQGLMNIISKVVQKNMCSIYVESCLLGRVIFIKETKAIMPYHFIKSIATSVKKRLSLRIHVKNPLSKIDYSFDISEMINPDDSLGKRVLFVDPSRDFALVELGHRHIGNFSDICSLFVETGIGSLKTGNLVAPVNPQEVKLKFYLAPFKSERGLRLGQSTFQSNIAQVLIYKGVGAVGDCGFPLFLADPSARSARITGFIIGEHSASTTVATSFVDQELLKLALKVGNGSNNPNYLETAGEITRCIQIGTLSRPPGTNSWTSIRKSRIWGSWGPATKRPAHLRPFVNRAGEKIDPFQVAMTKFELPYHKAPEVDKLRAIYSAIASHLVNTSSKFEVIDPTFEQCVAGIPDKPFFDSVNRSSSPGYPGCMIQKPDYPGKTWWFGKNQEFEFDSPACIDLRKEFEEARICLENGELPDWYYIFSLKDELLPLEKADRKTRGYSAESLPALLQTISIFKCFLAWTMENRIGNGFAPGMNVYSKEWDRLYHHLNNFGGDSMPGDFRHFDAIQIVLILDEMVEMIIAIYVLFAENFNDKAKTRMRTMWKHITRSKQIMRMIIMQVIGSNPSGNALTTLINGLYQLVLFFMAFQALVDDSQNSYEMFFEMIRFILYGDDSLICPAQEIRDRFNFRTVQEYFASLGIEYTSAKKDGGEVTDFVPLTEATFLKRSFRFEPIVGRFVAPLALETILEMPYWTKKGVLKDEIERVNVVNALRELSLHSEEVFNEWAPKIVKASVEKLGYLPAVVDRRELILFVTDAGRVWMRDLKISATPRYESISVSTYDRIFSDKTQKKQADYSACGGLKPSLFSETELDGLRDTNILFTACAGEVWANSSVKKTPAAISNELEGLLQDNKEAPAVVGKTTTLFVDDADAADNSVVGRETFDNRLRTTASLAKRMSIEDFLKKPILVAQNTVSSMTPNQAFVGAASPYIVDDFLLKKLEGYFGLRCDAEWRLEVTAPSTMAGVIGLFFEPFPVLRQSIPNVFGPGRSMLSRFHLPHILLDLSCETSATLTVPRINPATWWVSGASEQDNSDGQVRVVALSNLYVGTGTGYFSYRLYCTLTNVEMGAPAYRPIAGDLSLVAKEKNTVSGPQAAVGKLAMDVVANLPKIPLLTTLIGNARWALNAANGIAQAFGYSKPVIAKPVTMMTHTICNDLTTFDGADSSKPLALCKDNAVSAFKGFARSEYDEASFAYLYSKSSYIGAAVWADTDPSGTLIRDYYVGPRVGCLLDIPKRTVDPTIMFHLANNFNYWRGSIIITLRIAKTAMHSGRLRVTFNPFTDTAIGASEAQMMLNEVLDAREATEWSFRLPFISESQWKYTPSTFDDAEANYRHCCLGLFRVFVLGRLTHPDTVSSNVECMFFVRPGPDFELASPTQDTSVPVYNAASGDLSCLGEDTHFIGGYDGQLDPDVATDLCIGEKILSVYQLTKRFGDLYWDGRAALNTKTLDINPFVISCGDAVATTTPYPTGDFYSIFGPCYALHRGSMRLKAIVAPTVTGGVFVADSLQRHSYTGASVAAFDATTVTARNRPNVHLALFASSTNTCAEVLVPGYWNRPARPVMVANQANTWPDYIGPNTRVRFHTNVAATTWRIYRATGEDFQMGLFYTVPFLFFP